MSIIDWSDPEEMLGLLVEYIRDELTGEQADRERARFLRSLSSALEALTSHGPLPPQTILGRLRTVAESQPAAFLNDPAFVHVQDCIQELQRIADH